MEDRKLLTDDEPEQVVGGVGTAAGMVDRANRACDIDHGKENEKTI